MKKKKKNILIILFVIILIITSIYFINKPKNYRDYETYSYKMKNLNKGIFYEYYGINEIKWLNETTLYINTSTVVTCEKKIKNPSVEVNGNKIYLKHITTKSPKVCAKSRSESKSIEYIVKKLNSSKEYIIEFNSSNKYIAKIKKNQTYNLTLIPFSN